MQARLIATMSLVTLLLAGLAFTQNVEPGLTNGGHDALARVGIEGEDIPLPAIELG